MGRKKIYLTEEEKKKQKRENQKRYYQKHKEKHKESVKRWGENHREALREIRRRYRENNLEKIKEKQRHWRDNNKEKWKKAIKRWIEENPIKFRASNLVSAYSQCDRKHNRGECTLTAQWIVDNIFPKPCHWCGETGWEIMGCDRINNELPHTPDNVNPCCDACNKKRGTKTYEEYLETLRAKKKVL